MINEHVRFRLFRMPCCGQLLCWVNPRLPTFCPECGKPAYTELRFNGVHTLITDEGAHIRYSERK